MAWHPWTCGMGLPQVYGIKSGGGGPLVRPWKGRRSPNRGPSIPFFLKVSHIPKKYGKYPHNSESIVSPYP